ncbi:ATP-grasp domain-containing protein [Staphylococcus saccharolyticus]|uniref:ATP-grasp domain-containing protein n=1 Tax=Staphylococcus saccharolyticus TaxID=33028 RepID=UPI00102DCF83|nr:ATP-grasp domain-containing protein [Staphylococcus saccharolyticus]MBL7574037.1 ATP-grasp domain-containing protein [Staphylococcus saccharolyticus]MBL7585040.1 ATP-grasp domain-containing protein [Staphylococcus saccharolyticus]MBL7639650.1 ATP-grasp domain-containing protein [Staphylococcus saccharolyticus]QRJ68373.1 ATP-grasp domain-containing protein [Staphylococcus saccharolyticus]TAA91525.1 phosphoribosylglycinamide synthetase [Staphylococcus saccharolyticus]
MKTLLFINIRSHKVERVQPIIEAKNLGYRVVLMADKEPKFIGNLLDELIIIDSYDIRQTINKVMEYNKNVKISGILTWSDKDVELVSYLNKELGLPGVNPEIVQNVRNKYNMRQAISNIKNLSPKFQRVESLEGLRIAVDYIGIPGILKPVGASGSKGIFKIESAQYLENIFHSLVDATSPKNDKVYTYYPNEYIYEEYIEGEEFSVEGVVQNNEVFIAGITDKRVTDDFSLEYIAFFPSDKPKHVKDEIKGRATLAIQILEIDNCAFHLEGRLTKEGFKVIEVAARPAGGFITSHLIRLSSGYSFIEKIIDVSVGNDVKKQWPDFEKNNKKLCYYSIRAHQSGTFKKIEGLDNIMEIPGVKLVIPLKEAGDKVVMPPEHFSSCFVANIILEGRSTKEIENIINKIEEFIKVEIQ